MRTQKGVPIAVRDNFYKSLYVVTLGPAAARALISLDVRAEHQCLRKSDRKGSRSPLHNRLRPIPFINPESIRGRQPLQVTRVSLQDCNDWQDKFSMANSARLKSEVTKLNAKFPLVRGRGPRFSAPYFQEIHAASPASINRARRFWFDAGADFAMTTVEAGCGAWVSGYHRSHPNRMRHLSSAKRECQLDGCAATNLAFNCGRAAVKIDNRFHESQSQACSIRAAR